MKHRPTGYICMLLCMLSAALGCSRNELPKGVLDEERMEALLTDAYLAEGYYIEVAHQQPRVEPDLAQTTYDSLLARHGVSREQWESSLSYYEHHLKRYDTIHHHVLNRLEALQQSYRNPQP